MILRPAIAVVTLLACCGLIWYFAHSYSLRPTAPLELPPRVNQLLHSAHHVMGDTASGTAFIASSAIDPPLAPPPPPVSSTQPTSPSAPAPAPAPAPASAPPPAVGRWWTLLPAPAPPQLRSSLLTADR